MLKEADSSKYLALGILCKPRTWGEKKKYILQESGEQAPLEAGMPLMIFLVGKGEIFIRPSSFSKKHEFRTERQ